MVSLLLQNVLLIAHILADSMQSPESNVHNGEISPEEFDRLSLLLRPPTDRSPEDSSPMDTSPSPFTGLLLPEMPSTAHPLTSRRLVSHLQMT